MKNVFLIGDSIRLGYESKLRELLGDDVTVYAPEENCRFTKFALWGIHWWWENMGCPHIDVAHFNAGIWDLHRCTGDGQPFTLPDEYGCEIGRLGRRLQLIADQVIFANIIPGGAGLDEVQKINALENSDSNFTKVCLTLPEREWNADVLRYNEIAELEMAKCGIPVNDLHSVIAADTGRFIGADGIHPTPDGYAALAEKCAFEIRKYL